MIDATAFYDPVLPWSGRAEELRKQKAGVALVSELGRNYDTYHEELSRRLVALGRPRPEDYKTIQPYLEAWAKVQAVVRAEDLLRLARDVAAGRGPLQPSERPPLVDQDDRLMHVEVAEKLSKAELATETSP